MSRDLQHYQKIHIRFTLDLLLNSLRDDILEMKIRIADGNRKSLETWEHEQTELGADVLFKTNRVTGDNDIALRSLDELEEYIAIWFGERPR